MKTILTFMFVVLTSSAAFAADVDDSYFLHQLSSENAVVFAKEFTIPPKISDLYMSFGTLMFQGNVYATTGYCVFRIRPSDSERILRQGREFKIKTVFQRYDGIPSEYLYLADGDTYVYHQVHITYLVADSDDKTFLGAKCYANGRYDDKPTVSTLKKHMGQYLKNVTKPDRTPDDA